MSGARRPMAVNIAAGGKHWTKAEIESRQASEVQLTKPNRLRCPSWLNSQAARLFRAYSKELLANLPVSTLDAGTLARMCDAEALYAKAAALRDQCVEKNDQKGFALWMSTIATCERIARSAANDLGCTITSRCRLVVPQVAECEDDPLDQLLRLRG